MFDPGKQDTLFDTPIKIAPFSFNDEVVAVFEDMISRSVPGYGLTLEMIAMLSRKYAQDNSVCYDLGCSLGAASLAMAQAIRAKNCSIVAVDSSGPMLQKAKALCPGNFSTPIAYRCEDVCRLTIDHASVVVMNFTLQFIHEDKKQSLLNGVFRGLMPGGLLILSEKICFDDGVEQNILNDFHHGFKKFKGYSDLEISQKRNALEKVLIPDTLETHRQRLAQAGFTGVHTWFQCFNFTSLVAFKAA